MSNFQRDLEQLINEYSLENDSNTPDFILAGYLKRCLDNFNITLKDRENWYRPIQQSQEYCDFCDGCGWFEGGDAIQTTCHKCGGSGIIDPDTVDPGHCTPIVKPIYVEADGAARDYITCVYAFDNQIKRQTLTKRAIASRLSVEDALKEADPELKGAHLVIQWVDK